MRGTIVAMGGGGFSMEETPVLDDFVLSLAPRPRPHVVFVPTASGDSPEYVGRFAAAFEPRAELSWLSLFNRDADLVETLADADIVYVGGGNTANLIALWRLHGLDTILRDAAARGVILAGVSAGALCWFECGVTDSFGPQLAPLTGGLGFLAGAFTPHYDGDPARRPLLQGLVRDGTLPDAWAADDGCALVFEDGALADLVTSRPGARAYRVTPAGETPHDARLLT
ncbi:MAG TPA: peptidase E [Kofleriaceae bacterium]|nr:peptidase E [Kofleriaceae bacterium]